MAGSTTPFEEFLILFSSNSDDIKKGADTAKQSTDSLEKSINNSGKAAEGLGTSLIGANVGSFTNQIRDMAIAGGEAVLAYLGLKNIIGGFLSQVNETDKIGNLSDELGDNISKLGDWAAAVHGVGGNVDGFLSAIKQVERQLAVFADTGHSRLAALFEGMGIKMTETGANGKKMARDILDILPEIAAKFETMSKPQSSGIGNRLGFDDQTIMLLQRGRQATLDFLKTQKELGEITTQDKEAAQKFKLEMAEVTHGFDMMFVAVGTFILPVLTKLGEWFIESYKFIHRHKELLEITAGVLTAVFLPAILTGIGALTTFAITALIAAAPFLLMAAGIAIAVLAIQDIYVWMNGGHSVIGKYLGSWKDFAKEHKHAIDNIKTSLSILKDGLMDVSGAMHAFKDAGSFIVDELMKIDVVAKTVYKTLDLLFSTFDKLTNLGHFIGQAIPTASDDKANALTGNIYKTGGNFLSVPDDKSLNDEILPSNHPLITKQQEVNPLMNTQNVPVINTPAAILNQASNTSLNSMTSNSILHEGSSSTVAPSLKIDKVEIHTQSNDPQAIKNEFLNHMNDHLNSMINYHDNGMGLVKK